MSASVTAARPSAPSRTACSAVSSSSVLRSLSTSCSSCDLQGEGEGEKPLLALASGSGMVEMEKRGREECETGRGGVWFDCLLFLASNFENARSLTGPAGGRRRGPWEWAGLRLRGRVDGGRGGWRSGWPNSRYVVVAVAVAVVAVAVRARRGGGVHATRRDTGRGRGRQAGKRTPTDGGWYRVGPLFHTWAPARPRIFFIRYKIAPPSLSALSVALC